MSRTGNSSGAAIFGAARAMFTRLAQDTRGNTLILTAAALIPLIALVGSGIDMGRGYLAQARLQQACDAAVLAGRRAMSNSVVDTTVIAEANKFFKYNFDTGVVGTNGSAAFGANPFTPTVGSAANSTVTVTAATTLPTTIMKMFGFATLPISVTCFAKQDFVNTDVMLVLDTTGSMEQDVNGNDVNGGSTSKIAGLRSAVMALYDQLAPVQTQLESVGLRLRYSIVPYSSTVNVGAAVRAVNATYLNDAASYQTRVANYTTPVYVTGGTPTNTNETFGYAIADVDCLKYGYNQSFTGFTPNPAGEPIAATTLTYYQPTTWGGSNTISGTGTKTCVRTKTVYPRYTTRYAFTDFSYQKDLSVDTSTYKSGGSTVVAVKTTAQDANGYNKDVMGGSVAVASTPGNGYDSVYVAANAIGTAATDQVVPASLVNGTLKVPARVAGTNLPVATAPATINETWSGCIEERKTSSVTSSSGYGVPSSAYDLNIDTIPTSTDTRWSPHWPSMIWYRAGGNYTGSDYQNKQMTDVRDASLGYYACPSAAVRLKAFSRTELQTFVNNLVPIGGTYHDIGMIWGARFLSPDGIFGSDNPATYGNMPVSRYIIFLTDGQMAPNPDSYTAYGVEYMDQRVTGTAYATNQLANHVQRLKMICNAAKSKGSPSPPRSILR
jgi:Flp pilus assembly protein TadG